MIKNDLKIAVMFFSATGNSKRIAQKIAAYFCEKAVLIDITHRLKESHNCECNQKKTNLLPYDLLFVVLPVHAQMCSAPILKYLKNLQFKASFVPCVSYGSVSAGKALKQVSRIFQKKGAVLLAGAEFVSAHFYYPPDNSNTENTSVTKNNLNHEIIYKESFAVKELCSKVIFRLDKNIALKKIHVSHFNPLSLILPKKRAQIGVKIIYLNKNKCVECQACKNICPYNAIKKDFKVNSSCQRCGYCVKNCKNNNIKLIPTPIMRSYLKTNIDYSRNTKIY